MDSKPTPLSNRQERNARRRKQDVEARARAAAQSKEIRERATAERSNGWREEARQSVSKLEVKERNVSHSYNPA